MYSTDPCTDYLLTKRWAQRGRTAASRTVARETDGVILVLPAAPGLRRPAFALRVDDVNTVLEVGEEHIQPMAADWRGAAGRLVSGIVRIDSAGPGATALVQLMEFAALGQVAGLPASD